MSAARTHLHSLQNPVSQFLVRLDDVQKVDTLTETPGHSAADPISGQLMTPLACPSWCSCYCVQVHYIDFSSQEVGSIRGVVGVDCTVSICVCVCVTASLFAFLYSVEHLKVKTLF